MLNIKVPEDDLFPYQQAPILPGTARAGFARVRPTGEIAVSFIKVVGDYVLSKGSLKYYTHVHVFLSRQVSALRLAQV